MKVYQRLALLLLSTSNCTKTGNKEWQLRHEESIAQIMKSAPSGGGIDSGVKLLRVSYLFGQEFAVSTPEKLVFQCDYHHMDDSGYYDGWTEHRVTARGSLWAGLRLQISGNNRNDIKDYLHETMHDWLSSETAD